MTNKISLTKTNIQSGMALVVALVFVTAMTALLLTMSGTAVLEERVASNERNRQMAFQAAEAIVRYVESDTLKQKPVEPFDGSSFKASCAKGFCRDQGNLRWKTHNFDNPNISRSFLNASDELQELDIQPTYFIEFIGLDGGQKNGICPVATFRVVGRGQASDGAEYLVEALYRIRPTAFADGSC